MFQLLTSYFLQAFELCPLDTILHLNKQKNTQLSKLSNIIRLQSPDGVTIFLTIS